MNKYVAMYTRTQRILCHSHMAHGRTRSITKKKKNIYIYSLARKALSSSSFDCFRNHVVSWFVTRNSLNLSVWHRDSAHIQFHHNYAEIISSTAEINAFYLLFKFYYIIHISHNLLTSIIQWLLIKTIMFFFSY